MAKYRISISLDGENFFWIVVDKEKLIKKPTKEDLMGTKLKSYNKTNVCPRCREEKEKEGIELTYKSILYPKNVCKEKDKNGNKTEKWICHRHEKISYQRYNPNSTNNIIKSIRDRRTGNLDPNSEQTKGDNSQELACKLYGWIDLNNENDNYSSGAPIDCYDPKTGLNHQVQRRRYNQLYQWWSFTGLEREWIKKFENMTCFCISKDGKIVDRIYIFPWKEIMRVKSIGIYNNPSKGGQQNEQYRITDEYELKKANDIWKEIIKS